jgi:acyl carrier protein
METASLPLVNDETVHLLLGIWADVLDVSIPNVDINKSLFDLGVDSFSIILICGLIEERMGKVVTPQELMLHPTIHGLAQFLSQNT